MVASMREMAPNIVTPQSVDTLLEAMASHDVQVRAAAVAALSRLPLADEDLIRVARAVLEVLPDRAVVADIATVDAAVGIPVAEVRERVHRFVRADDRDVALAAAVSLARVGDPAGASVLVDALREGPREDVVVAIARCGAGDRASEAWQLAAGYTDDAQFWVSLGVTRNGLIDPWRATMRRLIDGSLDLEFDWVDPTGAIDLLWSMAPLPEQVAKELGEAVETLAEPPSVFIDLLYGHHEPEAGIGEGDAAPSPPPPGPEIGTATSGEARAAAETMLSAGPFLSEPDHDREAVVWQDADELLFTLASLDTQDATGFVTRAFQMTDPDRIDVGNLIVKTIAFYPRAFQPDTNALLNEYSRFRAAYHGPQLASQVAWTVSRTDLDTVISDLRPTITGTSGETQLQAVNLVADSALYVRVDAAPVFGGGSMPTDLPVAARRPMMRIGMEEMGDAEPATTPRGGSLDDIGLSFAGPIALAEDEPAPEADPPRSAYARMDCDGKLVAGRPFDLVVGLRATPDPEVVGDEMHRPESSVGDYDLWIHVTAEGFQLTDGETWRRGIPVTAAEPYPATTFHLTPDEPSDDVDPAAIKATFSVDGQVIGWAVRPVAVVRADVDLAEVEEPETPSMDIGVPTAAAGADLSMTFEYSRDRLRLHLKLETGFPDIEVPDQPIEIDIGAEAGIFAQGLISRANANEGTTAGYFDLRGESKDLAVKIKSDAFWDVFATVIERCRDERRRPAVLILSEDPYVPWELMALDEVRDVRYDPSEPAFLGAQVDVGRWLLDRPTPKVPPPIEKVVGPMAVIWSDYTAVSTQNLKSAKEEAAALAQAPYSAADIDATRSNVFEVLQGNPPADVLHFAVHARYEPNSIEHGLLLADQSNLNPAQVRGAGVVGSPFVYVNACQIGSGNKNLGSYSGMAAAFLRAGASAVVAPLWSVRDDIAKEIALGFYEKVFAGRTPASVLREERAKFTEDGLSSTYLAYQFFGHPKMAMSRRDESPNDGG